MFYCIVNFFFDRMYTVSLIFIHTVPSLFSNENTEIEQTITVIKEKHYLIFCYLYKVIHKYRVTNIFLK